jgi:DNA processing protein
MALLCDASVIVEAGESSGTLSQGWEALRLGRPLFILKSVLKRGELKWPQEMLQYGARVLEEPEELFAEIPHTSVPETLALAF